MQVSVSKVRVENWVDIGRYSTVRVRHEISGENKTTVVTEAFRRLWIDAGNSYPGWHPTNTKYNHYCDQHSYHFPINRTVTGGVLIPRGFLVHSFIPIAV